MEDSGEDDDDAGLERGSVSVEGDGKMVERYTWMMKVMMGFLGS